MRVVDLRIFAYHCTISSRRFFSFFFFFNDTATTEIYTLSLHDALPIYLEWHSVAGVRSPDRRSQTSETLMRHWPRTDSRFWAGLVLTALLALAVPAAWYVAYDVIWAPSHDDMVSLLLSSEGHNRADLVLSAPTTSRRSAREILGTIAPRPDYGVLDTVLDVYRLSINPPVYLGLLNLWRRIVGGSFPAAMMLSLVFCSMSACALFCVVAWERGWLTGLLFSALYCFSPTYWEAALATRQYALSALLASVLAGSLTWWLRTGQASSLPAAAAFVAVGMLLTLTSYQSSVLVLSLLAGPRAPAILSPG